MLQRFKPLIWPAFFTVLVCALLVSLGLWQLRRLAWKEALIARIEQRTKAPASPLPRLADWPHLDPEAYEYRHVALIGSFDHMEEALIFRGTGGGTTGLRQPGYLVLTPFRLSSGGTVIINRGFWRPLYEYAERRFRLS